MCQKLIFLYKRVYITVTIFINEYILYEKKKKKSEKTPIRVNISYDLYLIKYTSVKG